ncbi:MBL fold metallo-hydrolase [Amycolatopsis saalfeldensis]|uniref:Glyoxylase, beta-lactamase superfamily II n=1 Tax=Amycolatopsis saalfeldensis TaxID=394193 RepID=A0A1H8YJ82_9PSEU|nr:MBL fold metallo-hydrolase [Amycolatopsis saalfeldensis]SEP52264.1 Glyoxylase, beta-lactamase superfamily II [Amycolatopsis saalfeldensis]
MAEQVSSDPVVQVGEVQEIAPDLVVIPDRNVPLVPNIGIIGGKEAVLIVETGMGPSNAEIVLKFAEEHARGRKLYLTTTHFHPEHAFGAQVFAGKATFLVNQAQADDLRTKGPGYLGMFRGLGDAVARRLEGVELAQPDVVYGQAYDLDLGGRVVQLRATGRAHSRGDQVVKVPDADVLFTGDLVEAGQFAIFPWFPPHGVDVSGTRWLAVMQCLAAEPPRVVVPGHGAIGDASLLADVRDYLTLLRDETWTRRDSAMSEGTIVEEISALMIQRYPEWAGREWLETGAKCLCSEHSV